MTQCTICGGVVTRSDKVRQMRVGQRTVGVRYSAAECAACGEDFYTPEEADAVQKQAAASIESG